MQNLTVFFSVFSKGTYYLLQMCGGFTGQISINIPVVFSNLHKYLVGLYRARGNDLKLCKGIFRLYITGFPRK